MDATALRPGDYVSPDLEVVVPDFAFPEMTEGDVSASAWPFLRRTITGTTVQQFPPERAETLTAAGLMCRQALGQTVEAMPAAVLKAKDRLLDKPPQWAPDEGRIDHCYWFFGTEAT